MNLMIKKPDHSMAEGAPLRHILNFCLPLIVGNVFQ